MSKCCRWSRIIGFGAVMLGSDRNRPSQLRQGEGIIQMGRRAILSRPRHRVFIPSSMPIITRQTVSMTGTGRVPFPTLVSKQTR